jgi:uncharacterized lipoprotein YddW (UPF0748 family)
MYLTTKALSTFIFITFKKSSTNTTVSMSRKLFFSATLLCILIYACKTSNQVSGQATPTSTPKAAREFRAAWVATVSNINWPSKPGLSTAEQKSEAIALLDFLKDHNFNAVVFQVRPQTDALYKSNLEPWSYYLTGEVGKAPDPYYDPLEFWTTAAHDRGLEMHVWLNPYRSHHKDGGKLSDKSFVKTRPELSVFLKEGYWWMDPAKKETQDHSHAVVMDLVKRYNIDGVHFDDYFYPYTSYNLNEDFPDHETWAAYQKQGGKLSRADWRRDAVNKFISRVYKSIKAEKPYVKFGLSPFGIWRPGYPETVEGLDQYDKLYADAKLWLNKGWIDYFAPQLYWPINRPAQSFPVLLGWWAQENTMKRHLWPGINVGRDTGYRTVSETVNQIMISRGMLPESNGVIHWSISSVVKNTVLAKTLVEGTYRKQALVPASPWLDHVAPKAPQVKTSVINDALQISWEHTNETDVFRWVVYYKYGNAWNYKILNRQDRVLSLNTTAGSAAQKATLNYIAVTAVDRVGNESVFKEIAVK